MTPQKTKTNNSDLQHIPVLLSEVTAMLAPQKGDSYLDVTAGYAGHAAAVMDTTQNPKAVTLIDRDQKAIDVLKQNLGASDVEIIKNDFLTASLELATANKQFDMILADLGVSSPHLNNSERGFAFSSDGPLDMRMDQSQELTAELVVNTFTEDKLAEILKVYGEEPHARKIARLIKSHRPIKTTMQLANVVKKAYPRYVKSHPATRTFQAVRIAVNDELRLVDAALPVWLKLLKPGGRLAIISFHSLEDRIVKNAFKDITGDRYGVNFSLLTKRPITASQTELVLNPRSRSSKLRGVAKIKTKEREYK